MFQKIASENNVKDVRYHLKGECVDANHGFVCMYS